MSQAPGDSSAREPTRILGSADIAHEALVRQGFGETEIAELDADLERIIGDSVFAVPGLGVEISKHPGEVDSQATAELATPGSQPLDNLARYYIYVLLGEKRDKAAWQALERLASHFDDLKGNERSTETVKALLALLAIRAELIGDYDALHLLVEWLKTTNPLNTNLAIEGLRIQLSRRLGTASSQKGAKTPSDEQFREFAKTHFNSGGTPRALCAAAAQEFDIDPKTARRHYQRRGTLEKRTR